MNTSVLCAIRAYALWLCIPAAAIPSRTAAAQSGQATSAASSQGHARELMPDSATSYFAGNIVRGTAPRMLIQSLMGATGRHFSILVRRSSNDGANWSSLIPIASNVDSDAYDPQLLRVNRRRLLLGFHSGGSLRFYSSRDGGRHWRSAGTLESSSGTGYSEVFMLRLPGVITDRIALLYAACQRRLKMGHDDRVKMGQVVGAEP